jgi:hypothetical protein
MSGNYIQIGGKKRTVKFSEANVTRDEQGRFAKKGSGGGKKSGKIPGTQLLTKEERLRRNPNSRLQGAAIEARKPSESALQFRRRKEKAVKNFNRLMKGKKPK